MFTKGDRRIRAYVSFKRITSAHPTCRSADLVQLVIEATPVDMNRFRLLSPRLTLITTNRRWRCLLRMVSSLKASTESTKQVCNVIGHSEIPRGATR